MRSWGAKLGSPQQGQAKSWGPPALAGGTSGVGAAFNQLSLPSPAPPGPYTRPRTSWRTSATCSMTWPTSWTRCWTEPCSLLPFPASGCSASARGDGGKSGSSTARCLRVSPAASLPALCTAAGNVATPPHPPRVTGPRAPRLHVARPGPAMGVRRFPPDWQQEESPEGLRLWSRRPQRSPRTALRSLHKGPFSFHTALPSPASHYLSPANNVSKERPPWAAATELAIY